MKMFVFILEYYNYYGITIDFKYVIKTVKTTVNTRFYR